MVRVRAQAHLRNAVCVDVGVCVYAWFLVICDFYVKTRQIIRSILVHWVWYSV